MLAESVTVWHNGGTYDWEVINSIATLALLRTNLGQVVESLSTLSK